MLSTSQRATDVPESAPQARTSARRRIALSSTLVLLLGASAWHLGGAFLSAAPLNVVATRQPAETLMRHISPFFAQNWQLFAPDPISEDTGLLLKARHRVDGRTVESRWIDITTPRVDRSQSVSGRLLPNRVHRMPGTLVQLASWEDPDLRRLRNRPADERRPGELVEGGRDRPEQPADRLPISRTEAGRRRSFEQFLRSLLSAEALSRFGDVVAVRARLVVHEFPRFSQRHDRGPGRVFYEDQAWMPVADVRSAP
jgi:hypothetical protein